MTSITYILCVCRIYIYLYFHNPLTTYLPFTTNETLTLSHLYLSINITLSIYYTNPLFLHHRIGGTKLWEFIDIKGFKEQRVGGEKKKRIEQTWGTRVCAIRSPPSIFTFIYNYVIVYGIFYYTS